MRTSYGASIKLRSLTEPYVVQQQSFRIILKFVLVKLITDFQISRKISKNLRGSDVTLYLFFDPKNLFLTMSLERTNIRLHLIG